MIEAAIPQDEATRLESLRSLGLLDTPPEERFDRITRMAKRMFGVPIALVSLVDENRQWFKSCIGMQASETPRNISFCAHAILGDDVFVIPDAALDERFRDNPLVTGKPGLRFYAGQPLVLADGSRLGTLCIIAPEPRTMNDEDRQVLRDLAKMVEAEVGALNLATRCELTGLANRRGFLALGRQALSECDRGGLPVAMACLELDGYPSMVDRCGVAEADRALRDFAAIQRNTFRGSDIIGHLDREQFAILMNNCNEDQCQSALVRLQNALNRRNRDNPGAQALAFNAGVLSCDTSQDVSIEMLLASASELMHMNKQIRKIGSPPPAGVPALKSCQA